MAKKRYMSAKTLWRPSAHCVASCTISFPLYFLDSAIPIGIRAKSNYSPCEKSSGIYYGYNFFMLVYRAKRPSKPISILLYYWRTNRCANHIWIIVCQRLGHPKRVGSRKIANSQRQFKNGKNGWMLQSGSGQFSACVLRVSQSVKLKVLVLDIAQTPITKIRGGQWV